MEAKDVAVESQLQRFFRVHGLQSLDKVRSALLLVGVACQFATVFITEPLWLIREMPPNLPTFMLPEIDFLWPVYFSLVAVLIVPRQGMAAHWAVIVVAGFFDQYRLQPQFYAIAVLMSACVWESWHNFARWFLVSTWLWAGLQKLVSSDWFGHASFWLVQRAGFEGATDYHVGIAVIIALTELSIGILGWVRPRWATYGGILMHSGIIVVLSPIFLDWNESVIPWNLSMAVIGGWVMWTTREVWPRTVIQRGWAIAWLTLPLGFFVGWMDHGFSGVLYSDSLPRGQITRSEGIQRIRGWGDLHVPFPNERRTLRMFFEQSAAPGDYLHVSDPRYFLEDQYFVLEQDGTAREIARDAFFDGVDSVESGPPFGVGLDEIRAIFALRQAGVKMLRESADAPVYAVAFTSENYSPSLLKALRGLPNVRQVQLSGTRVTDADLESLACLYLLTGLGIENTAVTDEGIEKLVELPFLSSIESAGTSISDECLQRILDSQH